MDIPQLHSWSLSPKEAVGLQRELAERVESHVPLLECDLLACADVSYNRFSPIFYAAVVVLRTSDLTIVETQEAVAEARFPYVPGLLSFREAPVLLEAFAKLRCRPDVVMVDGHGQAHPRRFGIACHLGLWLGLPTIGSAKTLLYGEFDEPANKPGACSPLRAVLHKEERESATLNNQGEIIGSVVRTKAKTKPVFVSVGHKIDLPSCVSMVLKTCRGYRLPEPIRAAHEHVNEVRRRAKK